MQKTLIVVLIVAVVALVGVLVWQNWGKAEPVANNQPPITDETANWKVYWDEEYGFEFKYADYLEIYPMDKTIKTTDYFALIGPEYFRVIIKIDKNIKDDLQVYLNKVDILNKAAGTSSDEVFSSQQVTVGGLPAIRRREERPNITGGNAYSINTYMKKGDLLLMIESLNPGRASMDSGEGDIRGYNEILSTFKFIK